MCMITAGTLFRWLVLIVLVHSGVVELGQHRDLSFRFVRCPKKSQALTTPLFSFVYTTKQFSATTTLSAYKVRARARLDQAVVSEVESRSGQPSETGRFLSLITFTVWDRSPLPL